MTISDNHVKNLLINHIVIIILFTIIYIKIYEDDKKSFYNMIDLGEDKIINFFYFSITTHTSVGYGDIIPLTRKAKIAVTLHQIAWYCITIGFIVNIIK
jgi:hypothetical protein